MVLEEVSLDEIHLALPSDRLTNSGGSGVFKIGQLGTDLMVAYHQYVRWLAKSVIKEDLVFEKDPWIRFHMPGRLPDRFRDASGTVFAQHVDMLLGDFFEQINCWIPLTDCQGSASLQLGRFLESQKMLWQFCDQLRWDPEAFADNRDTFFEFITQNPKIRATIEDTCKPIKMSVGQFLLFDARVLHGAAENVSERTRVSID